MWLIICETLQINLFENGCAITYTISGWKEHVTILSKLTKVKQDKDNLAMVML